MIRIKNRKECVTRVSNNDRPVGFTRDGAIERFAHNARNSREWNTYQKVYASYWHKSLFKTSAKLNYQGEK